MTAPTPESPSAEEKKSLDMKVKDFQMYLMTLEREHASLKQAHKKIANVKNWRRVPSEFITVETLAGISQEVLTHTTL